VLTVAAILTAALGCSRSAIPTPPPANESGRMDEIRQEILLSGFDPLGEPVLRVMADGSVQVVFNFMPPSYVPDELGWGPFADFDQQLERAVGVPVLWDDREVFIIHQPKPDTVERLRAFIEGYRGK